MTTASGSTGTLMQVTVGSAGVKHAEVQITDLKDPKKSSVTVKVEGTKVTTTQLFPRISLGDVPVPEEAKP